MKPVTYIMGGLAIVLVLAAVASQLVRVLLFGWISFLGRVAPNIRIDWLSVAVGVLAFVGVIVGIQRLAPMFHSPWKLRWTLATVGIVILLFTAGIAMTALVHQSIWLARSEPTLMERRLISTSNREKALELAKAADNYHGSYRRFPAGGAMFGDKPILNIAEKPLLHSWKTQLLSYLEYDSQLGNFQWDKSWLDDRNFAMFSCILPPFIQANARQADLRNEDGYGLSHYSANIWALGPDRDRRRETFRDGGANTILFGEVNANYRPWGDPINWRDPTLGIDHPEAFGGPPAQGGAHFSLADGSVRFVANHVSPEVLKALSVP